MNTKNEIFHDIENVLKNIIGKEIVIDLTTPLLGDGNLIDSISIVELIAWSNDYYGINVLEDDIYLECLKSIGTFVDKIYVLQEN